MKARLHVISLLCAAPTFAFVGCSVPEPEAVATIRGQISPSTGSSPPSAVLLAMGWYPTWFGYTPAGSPKAILSGRAIYRGTFPQDFTFDLHGPPPEEALADLSVAGGAGVIAFGVLIAFEDGNRNHALDEASAAAASPDRVAGISIADPSLPPPLHHYAPGGLRQRPRLMGERVARSRASPSGL